MTKGRLIRALGLAAGLVLALAGSAQAGPHGDVLTVKHPYSLADSTRFEVQGRHSGEAPSSARGRLSDCEFPAVNLSLKPREQAVEAREVARNLRTCRAVFERGVPPKWSRSSSFAKPVSAGSRQSDGDAGTGVQSLSTAPTWGGWSAAWYRKRYSSGSLSSKLTQVESGADWTSRGGCIDATNTWFRNSAHLSSGWREISHRWSKINDICDYVVSSTNAHFRDDNFTGCSGGPAVDTYYNRVRFVGYPDGSIKGSKSSWNEPSCYGVLIAYYALYRR